jgi:tetratricopeptide (TPR) repeat protein
MQLDDAKSVKIIVSEPALEQLLAYMRGSAENAERVEETLTALRQGRLKCKIWKLSWGHHAVWSHALDGEHFLYFVHGTGKGSGELRLAIFGQPIPHNSSAYRHLLHMAGEAAYFELPREIRLLEERETETRPEFPERLLTPGTSIDAYLNPSEEQLLRSLEHIPSTRDDLHGRPFRVLTVPRPAIELPIVPGREQEAVLNLPPPLLVQGVAGSGKTTIIARFAHRQLVRSRNRTSILVLTYTDALRDFTHSILEVQTDLDPVDLSRIHVYTWRQLCDQLAEQAGLPAFRWAPEGHFLNFLHERFKSSPQNPLRSLLAEDIHEFIKASLKGEALDPKEPLQDRQSFLALPQVELDEEIDRKEIYDLAQGYQHSLASKGLRDDSDAARLLLSVIDQLPRYDFVLVDETQDYMLVQILLMVGLSRSLDGLVFAGDMDQVLYPSHFSWERVRTAIWMAWEKPAPKPVEIEYNYRNPQPVTELANTLLGLRSKRLGADSAHVARSNQSLNPRPLRLTANQAEIDELTGKLASRIGSLGIIQEHPDERFERSYSPKSAKGLEFNVVCLVNFDELYHDLLASDRKYSARKLFLRFSEVYVSITRARGQLLLLDRRPLHSGLWQNQAMQQQIDVAENSETLLGLVTARFQNQTSAEWEVDARDFEAQHAYAEAGECWEHAGKSREAAQNYERAKRWLKAAENWLAAGDLLKAANCHERAGRKRDAARDRALFYERNGQPQVAAKYWLEAGDTQRAAHLYEEMGELERAQSLMESVRSWRESARLLVAMNRPAEAAAHYSLAGDHQKAAECYEQVEDWAGAAAELLAAGEPQQAAVCYERAGHLDKAQSLMEKAHNWRESARLLVAMNRPRDAASHHSLAGAHQEAAELFEQLEDWSDAAKEWEAAGNLELAAQLWSRVGNLEAAQSCLDRAALACDEAGDLTCVARCCETSAILYLAHRQYEDAARQFRRAGKRWRGLVYAVQAQLRRLFHANKR